MSIFRGCVLRYWTGTKFFRITNPELGTLQFEATLWDKGNHSYELITKTLADGKPVYDSFYVLENGMRELLGEDRPFAWEDLLTEVVGGYLQRV